MICAPCIEERADLFDLPGWVSEATPAITVINGNAVCKEHLRRAIGLVSA